jgi:hypothetical protein
MANPAVGICICPVATFTPLSSIGDLDDGAGAGACALAVLAKASAANTLPEISSTLQTAMRHEIPLLCAERHPREQDR